MLTETITELEPGQGMLCIMNEEGDTRITWSRGNPDEVENARRSFRDLKAKGYAAYSVSGKEGERGEVLQEFNPNAERIIFAPPMKGG